MEPSAAPRPALLRALALLAWALLVFAVLKYAVYKPFLVETAWGGDFDKHYDTALALAAGQNPYRDAGLDGHGLIYYPQFILHLTGFLACWSRAGAHGFWQGAQVAGFALCFLVLALALGPARPGPGKAGLRAGARRHWPTVAAGLLGLFAPLYYEIYVGNIDVLNALLMLLLCAMLGRGSRAGAAAGGVVLAGLVLVKLLPLLLLPALAWAGRRRLAAWAMGLLGLYGVILLATGFWRWEATLLTHSLPASMFIWRHVSWSLPSFVAGYLPRLWDDPVGYGWLARGWTLGVLGATAAVFLAARPVSRRDARGALALGSVAIVLASPVLEYHHLVFALPALIFPLHSWLEGRWSGRRFGPVAGLWLFICLLRPVQDLAPMARPAPLFWVAPALAGLWLWLAGGWLAEARRAREGGA